MPDRAQGRGRGPKNARRDVGMLLIEQISGIIGSDYTVTLERERLWASITFSGTRHSIAINRSMQNEPNRLLAFAEKVATHKFDLPVHFVADVLVTDLGAQGDSMALEILTIIDPVARPANGA